MKTLRIFLLMLLVMVLPMRGALAVAAHCASDLGGQAVPVAVGSEHRDSKHHAHTSVPEHSHGYGHGHEHVSAEGTPDGSDADALPGDGLLDKCKFCSAFCSATPFVNVLSTELIFIAPIGVTFPHFVSPVPSHLSEGQDRPPQST